MGRAIDQSGESLRVRSIRRRGAPAARHPHRTGQGEPLPQPLRRGEPGSVRAHEGGEFPDGARTLRAKIDMASPNLNLRDPIMYRILHAEHHRTGDKWCIYPMYDFAHGQSDSIEGITHSICTLEFEDHRPLYDWYIEQLGIYHPQQIEFDRLNITYTLLSKRKLLQLVQQGRVSGWDDPRMPTISGLRRRGYTPEAIRNFCRRVGVSKTNGTTELGLLEYFLREDLNKRALRVMAVLRPLRVVIDNYPEGQVEQMEAVNNPEDVKRRNPQRAVLARALYRAGRLPRRPAQAVFPAVARTRSAAALRLLHHLHRRGRRTPSGQVVEIHCTYDPATRGGNAPDGRKVKSTIHWVSAEHAVDAEVRLYDNLFTREDPNQVDGRPGFHGQPESELARSSHRRQTGAESSRRRSRQPLSVRAARLLRRRSGHDARQARCSTEPWRCATPGPRSRRNPNDHSRTRRHSKGCRLRGPQGRRNRRGRRRGKSRAAVSTPGRCRKPPSHAALQVAKLTPADVQCVALVRPFAQDIHIAVRSAFSQRAGGDGGASRGARRLRVSTPRPLRKPPS